MSIDKFNNDAVLGLDVDLSYIKNKQTTEDSEYQRHLQQQESISIAAKSKRKTDKLTPEILLSNKGIPAILDSINHIKFQKKSKSKKLTSINAINKLKFGNDYHYNNLTLILRIFQNWGHQLGSHLKFDRFIENLLRGMNQSENRTWVRNLVREEMRVKMEKLRDIESNSKGNNTNKYGNKHLDGDDNDNNEDEIPDDIIRQTTNSLNNNDDQQWSELFGREQNDEEDEEDMYIKQTPMFSNYLRASSQPLVNQNLVFSQNDINDGRNTTDDDNQANNKNPNKTNIIDDVRDDDELNAFSELNETTLLQDLLMDKDEEEEEEDAHEESQGGIFSQYIANDSISQIDNTRIDDENSNDSDKTHDKKDNQDKTNENKINKKTARSNTEELVTTKQANTTIEFSDDAFSDDDDDYYNNI